MWGTKKPSTMLQTKFFFLLTHMFSCLFICMFNCWSSFCTWPFLGLWGPAGMWHILYCYSHRGDTIPTCRKGCRRINGRKKKDDHAINYWHLRAISLGDLERDACESGTYLIVLATNEGGAAPTGGGALRPQRLKVLFFVSLPQHVFHMSNNNSRSYQWCY